MTDLTPAQCCCSKDCYKEFEWRSTLAILGKPYTPQPEEQPKENKT